MTKFWRLFSNKSIAIFFVVSISFFTFLTLREIGNPQNTQQKAQASVLFQDNFEIGLQNWQLNSNTNITIRPGSGSEGSRAVAIVNQANNSITNANYRFSTPTQGRISVKIYDDLSSTPAYTFLSLTDDAYTQGVSIGIRPATSAQNYVYCPSANQAGCMDTGKKRTQGWHQFKIFVTPKGTYGGVDGDRFSYLPSNAINAPINISFTRFQRVNIGVQNGITTKLFDDVYIDSFPAPPASDFDIAMNFINTYLSSYGTIDVNRVDQMIRARESEFCPVDYATGTCPADGSTKPPRWHYMEQLMHVYIALLETAGAHEIRYLKNGNEADLSKAVQIIQYLDNEYPRWTRYRNSAGVSSLLTVVSTIIWDKLPTALQQSIKTHVQSEAEYFSSSFQPYSSHIGNSSGEENSWPAGYLHHMYLAFPDFPNANTYLERSRFFAFHSLSKGESLGGFTSRTIYDDNMFDNHNYHPHPGYGLGTAGTLAAMTLKTKQYTSVEYPEYTHNVLPVWKKMQEFVDYRTFRFKGNKVSPAANVFTPSGLDDWGSDAGGVTLFRVIKEVFNYNSYSDPETGFSTSDLARHSMEFTYYIKSGYLWRSEGPNIQFTEMLIDHGLAHPFPDWQNVQSYRWYKNAGAVWDYFAYFYYFDPTIVFRSRSDKITPTIGATTPTLTPTQAAKPTPTPIPRYDMCSYVTVLSGSQTGGGANPLTLTADRRKVNITTGDELEIIAVAKPEFNITAYTFRIYKAADKTNPLLSKVSTTGTIRLTHEELTALAGGASQLIVQVDFVNSFGEGSTINEDCSATIILSGDSKVEGTITPTQAPLVSPQTGGLIAIAGIAMFAVIIGGIFFFHH